MGLGMLEFDLLAPGPAAPSVTLPAIDVPKTVMAVMGLKIVDLEQRGSSL